MNKNLEFQRGIDDARAGERRKPDQSASYNNGYDVARAERDLHLWESDRRRAVK